MEQKLKDRMLEDICLVSLEKNVFDSSEFSFVVSPTKNNISAATQIGNNVIEMKFKNKDCLDPSFLSEYLEDLRIIRGIIDKYRGKMSIHSKWKSLRWPVERWKHARHYN